jgi:selenocysteine-specific elongation factor
MRYVLWATSGHIDHGKTALLKALTGIDADRLPEEKARGITIDLGFAHLDAGETSLSFVDVPGHEDFIKNMLAGVGGVDAILLVVAADESVKPQTREHFHIASLAGIRHGAVAITKADLVDEDILALAREEVRDLVRGTFLEKAPVVPVDSLSGQGVESLRRALLEVSQKIPGRAPEGFFRLPADRVFSIKGFGTVATGTVMAGEVREGATLRLLPQGLETRVRSIEVHGRKVPCARAGQRAALNLHGVAAGDLARGDMLVEGKQAAPSRSLDARVVFLAGTEQKKIPRRGMPVRFHHAASETIGRLWPLLEEKPEEEPEEEVTPGRPFLARIRLERERVFFAGERFVLRRHSPMLTVGGGVILDNHPPARERRVETKNYLRALPAGKTESPSGAVPAPPRESLAALFVRRAKARGLALEELSLRLGLKEEEVRRLLAEHPGRETVLVGRRAFASEVLKKLRGAAEKILSSFHERNPLRGGMPREALRRESARAAPPEAFEALLGQWEKEGLLTLSPEGVRLSSFSAGFSKEQQSTAAKLEAAFLRAGLAPPVPEALHEPYGEEGKQIFHYLLRSGVLVRVGQGYAAHRDSLESLRTKLRDLAERKPLFGVADFKALTGLSRKHAIPLLEYLDRSGVTERRGDSRRLAEKKRGA